MLPEAKVQSLKDEDFPLEDIRDAYEEMRNLNPAAARRLLNSSTQERQQVDPETAGQSVKRQSSDLPELEPPAKKSKRDPIPSAKRSSADEIQFLPPGKRQKCDGKSEASSSAAAKKPRICLTLGPL